MRISVVVPLFNKEKTVARALASIAAQSVTDHEVLVVDDGSTDQGAATVAAWKDSRVRLIQQANGGPGAARNTGWRAGQASLVAFLDADDEWEPEFLARALEHLDNPGVALAAQAWWDEPGSVYPEWAKHWAPGVWRASAATPVEEFVSRLAFCSPCTSVVRRDSLERYGGFYSLHGCRYAEDAHFFLKVLLNESVAMDHRPQARFHREDSALSGNYRRVRPIEPFLNDPEDVRQVCPAALRALLADFLCTRAMKTAVVLAYWGQREAAAELREKFLTARAASLPWYGWSQLGSARVTGAVFGLLGAAHRRWKAAWAK